MRCVDNLEHKCVDELLVGEGVVCEERKDHSVFDLRDECINSLLWHPLRLHSHPVFFVNCFIGAAVNLEEVVDRSKIDENRFEQEVLFYIEKTDVAEERSRLAAHCEHFEEVLKNGVGQGKKFGFIAQEIGREINTLGSKANDAEIQRLVVRMKDELEKIKEQVPQYILDLSEGVFTCGGNQLWLNNELSYNHEFKPSEDLLSFLKEEIFIACKADVLAPESIRAFIVGILIWGKLHHSTLPIIIFSEFIYIFL